MKSVKSILKVYKGPKIKDIKKINFSSVRHRNVYNITAPFKYEGRTYLIGRVENPKDETSVICFFKKSNSFYTPDNSFQKFELEDPALTKIYGSYILSGVETKMVKNKIRWRTIFYRGRDLRNLKKFAAGPWGMKDIRLIQLDDEKIGVFTRPRGNKGRRGRIGYIEIKSLSELKPRKISNASIIKGLFSRGEWAARTPSFIWRRLRQWLLRPSEGI